MTRETKNDIKFYICLFLSFGLMLTSLLLPPVNVITTSVLYAAIIILALGGLIAGIDLEGILKELNELKKLEIIESKRLKDEQTSIN